MHQFLLFTLYGPLQSWGNIAVGEFRSSDSVPTKSAIIGLVAACLGFQREEEGLVALQRSARILVRVDRSPGRLTDFHTAQVPGAQRNTRYLTRSEELSAPELHTVAPSRREYLTDGVFSVALWSDHPAPVALENVRDALLNPVFVPYLGRKSCPLAVPLSPSLIEATSALAAIGQYYPSRKWFPGSFLLERGAEVLVFSDDSPLSGVTVDRYTVRRDQPIALTDRQFDIRSECIGRTTLP